MFQVSGIGSILGGSESKFGIEIGEKSNEIKDRESTRFTILLFCFV